MEWTEPEWIGKDWNGTEVMERLGTDQTGKDWIGGDGKDWNSLRSEHDEAEV